MWNVVANTNAGTPKKVDQQQIKRGSRLREKLRDLRYTPVIFDFEPLDDRDLTETIKVLAGLSLFVVADITDPESVPQELEAIVSDYQVPCVPIIQGEGKPFATLKAMQRRHPHLLPVVHYPSRDELIECLESRVIQPALAKHSELLRQKNSD